MKKLLLILFICILGVLAYKKFFKQPYFIEEIRAFEKIDQTNTPPKNAIVFAGSSSITKWVGIRDSFPGYPIIARGIGGASYPDIIGFANEMIVKYQPKQVFIYCGDNDFAFYNDITPEKVAENFQKLFVKLRKELPNAKIASISIKPSPSRWNLEQKFIETNKLIKAYLEKEPNTIFIDIHSKMLLTDGQIDSTLFQSDNLHMNEKGYAVWGTEIKKYLLP